MIKILFNLIVDFFRKDTEDIDLNQMCPPHHFKGGVKCHLQ